LQGLDNIERQKRIALMYAETDATSRLGQQIEQLVDQRAANDDLIRSMDILRSSSVELFTSVADGSKSAKDAFKDFMGDMRTRILRMLAEKLVERLFGGFGSTGGGSAGGGIAAIFGGLFGGARGSGGPVGPGRIYQVNEQGPELLNIGRQQFLMTGQQSGNVVPITHNNDNTTNITINTPPQVKQVTGQQYANTVSEGQRRADARNR
jgi:hypothetical protein